MSLNNYKSTFLIGKSWVSAQPFMTINKNGDGIIAWNGGAKRIYRNQPIGDPYSIGPLFGLSNISLDKNGNGIALWYQLPVSSKYKSTPKSYFRIATIKNYKAEGKPVIIGETIYHSSYKDTYLLRINLDEKGKGIILWSKNGSSIEENLISKNDSYIASLDNYKVSNDSIEKTNSEELIQIIKKDNDNYSVVSLHLENTNINTLANSPNIDENGNGTISWLENKESASETLSTKTESPIIDDNTNNLSEPITDLYIQRVSDYSLFDEKILLLTDSNAYTKIDFNGDGVIVSSEYEKLPSEEYPTGFTTIYYRVVRNFIPEEKQKVSDYHHSISPVVDFDEYGNGLIVWLQVPGSIYARRIKDFELL